MKATYAAPLPHWTAVRTPVLQRCGGRQCPSGTCSHHDEPALMRRQHTAHDAPTTAPPAVSDVLRSPGQPLDLPTRTFMESRFGHDFSQVQVHTDARAAASADAVDARAYTVGRNIVLAAGEHQPATPAGQRLVAHELTHVLQQGAAGSGKLHVGEANDSYEQEADRVADRVMHMPAPLPDRVDCHHGVQRHPNGPAMVMRQQAQQGLPRADPIADAQRAAFIRAQVAYQRVVGIGPPSRDLQISQRQARGLARRIFQWDNPNMDQIAEIVGDMRARLAGGIATASAPSTDKECGNRAAYVVGLRPPIHLCPEFFSSPPESKIRTMLHEAAHIARIGSASQHESYCIDFDCESSCGGFDSADSWAHFVHCLSGQTPDKPQTITVPRPSPRRP